MLAFSSRLHGPELPPDGAPAAIELSDHALNVRCEDFQKRVSLEKVHLSLGGFNGDQWQFSWGPHGDTWVVFLQDVSVQRRMLEAPPAGLAREIAALVPSRRKHRIGTGIAAIVFAVLVGGPALLLGLFWWQSERIAEAVVDRIPVEAEQKLGALVFADIRTKLKLVAEGGATGAVRGIGERITRGSGYRYQWYVADDPRINAFAIPGGYVVVNSGLLLAADTAEELAGVLAHEVQHVERRHSLRALVYKLGFTALLSLALGHYSGAVVDKLAGMLGVLQFSRAQESDADLRGMAALDGAGIDPRGMLVFFQKMARRGDANIPLLSTHPASEERAKTLQRILQQSAGSRAQPLPYDWNTIKASLGKRPE